MRIDHLVYGVVDLVAGVAEVESIIGVAPVPGGAHPGKGTRNYLIGLGRGTYLEIIGPDPEQPTPEGGRPFGLDDLGEDRLVGWAVATADIEAAVIELAERDLDLGPVTSMERQTPSGDRLSWRITEPRGGVIPFLIDWGDSDHPSQSLEGTCRLHSLRVEAPDPQNARALIDVLDLDVDVRRGFEQRLAASIDSPLGRVVLW